MFEKAIKFIKENVFPNDVTCDLCGIETFGSNLCKDCLNTVTFNNGAKCPVCGRKTTQNAVCLECKQNLPVFEKALSPIVYEGGGKKLVLKFKNGNGYLKEYFADLIADGLLFFPIPECITYVPMTKSDERARGFNQAKLLAEAVSKRTDTPFIKDAIVKTKKTAGQKELGRKERAKNLEGSFKVVKKDEIKGKAVLLVDDILTTGATADEVSRCLLKAGAEKIYLATVASVEYREQNDAIKPKI